MRGWHFVALVLILSIGVAAVECNDTDDGGAKGSDDALKVLGSVKYGITSVSDTCLTSDEDGVSTNESKWLKEYYCAGGTNGQRMFELYDCDKLGYSGCKDGVCVGGTVSANGSVVQQTQIEHCGNKIIEKDKGEECDPPDAICFGKTTSQYGICRADCTCKISAAAEAAPSVCGDKYLDSDEECEADSDCATDHVCSSCSCVKVLSQEEIEAMKSSASEEKTETAPEEIKKEIDEKYETPEAPEVNLTGKNFSEEPGIKVATGIGGFFKKIFSWIAGLFA